MPQLYTEVFEEVATQLIDERSNAVDLITGLDDSARAIFIAQLFRKDPKPYLIVEPRSKQLNELYEDLTELIDEPVLHFPAEDSLAVEYSIASQERIAQRIAALNHLATGRPGIILTNVAGIQMRLSPVDTWKKGALKLQLGGEYGFNQLEAYLSCYGYQREPLVELPGQYSIRGSIVDIYPFDQANPIRLDFFDEELDSIRTFDPLEQTSIDNIDQVTITPAIDIVFPIEAQQALIPELRQRMDHIVKHTSNEEQRALISARYQETLDQLEQGESLKFASAYLSLWDRTGTSLLDYLSSDAQLIVMELGRIQQVEFQLLEENQFWIEQEVSRGQLLPNIEMKHEAYHRLREAPLNTLHFASLQRGMSGITFRSIHNYQYRGMNSFFHQMPLIESELTHWLRQGFIVQIAVSSKHEAQRTYDLLHEYDLPAIIQADDPQSEKINILPLSLSKGFELPLDKWVVITEQELFNQQRRPKVRSAKQSNAERLKDYNELGIGDYVVHPIHGIGRYTGIETIEINGNHTDAVAIEYRDQARILLPVENISQLQKYVASESTTPKLNKLGGTEWKKTKARVQSQVEDIADELIQLYAQREQERGFAFAQDTPEQYKFEDDFPYPETEDQLRSIQEIKRDMESDRPMDRLLVGDVGYGKTEVALRAVFKAVMDGKQVAFLVPTTVLAQQHYHTIIERFADWPFEVGLLSRFVSKAKQQETIDGLKTGAISIVVGTHRILSKDVVFNDLGLLIIDEEQRFGVKHKERLKQLRSQVDVLTLTATPIPRTLHMSMIGVRDLSLIETPPNNRYPVQTYVMERNNGVIKSAIEREMARGGQVFYLYNRVASIDRKAQEIQDLVPEARVAISHGQMSEAQLENVLLDFIEGVYDVLVTTTIIETGIDIPNANTLFVDDADRMGLSTLYQLRGRVGRTHRLAYAYLFYEPFKQLSEISEKRLNAIREFTELGSGFKLAMRDLSIRGAGNLLGQQQSGFIDSVGYELYTQMLQQAIKRKQGGGSQLLDRPTSTLDWQFEMDAYIPYDYISDERQKVGIYKLVQRIDSQEAYVQLQDELIDRYGEFPDPVSNLVDFALIKYYALEIGITQIRRKRQELIITFNEWGTQHLQGERIFKALSTIDNKAYMGVKNNQLELTLNIYNQAVDQVLNALIRFTRAAYETFDQKEEE